MEDMFFKEIRESCFDAAMRIYENNVIDVMFDDNCILKYAIKNKRIDVIKFIITLDDYHEFSMDNPPNHFISIMTLACKYCYYELIEYLHGKFYTMTWMDVNDLISNTKNANLVKNVLDNFINDENFAFESILCVQNKRVLDVMIEHGYKITDELLSVTDNEHIIRHAHENKQISQSVALQMTFHNYEHNNTSILKLLINEYEIDVESNLHRFTKNFFYDPIDCFKYVFEERLTSNNVGADMIKNIMNEAMMHRAHKIASFVHDITKVVPDEHSDVYDNIEYTRLVSSILDVTFKPKHLSSPNLQNFKYIIHRMSIDETNIDQCVNIVFLNESHEHIRVFLKYVPDELMQKQNVANIFVLCCMSSFTDIAKELWIKHKVNISLSTVKRGLLSGEQDYIDNFPINTPKRLVKTLMNDDSLMNVFTWVTDIFDIQLKYTHITQCFDDMYGNNPKILLHVLKNTTLNENQLKNVFVNVISHYENDGYYICKYLKDRYKEYVTNELTEILYKYALTYTQKAFELFETDSCNPSKCYKQSVYGNNIVSFEYLMKKYPDFLKSKSKSDELFKYACSCDSLDVVHMFCARFNRYEYKMDDEIVIPLIKNTLEYFIHKNEYDKIVQLMKKTPEAQKNEECNVCYERANVRTECSHHYCVTCITKWYARNTTCPMCKRKLNIKKCHHIC